jgi:3-hydroxybutyryl-CoA dehydrogenase
MGAGIAEVFARNGVGVVGVERDSEQLARGRGHVEQSTGRAVARGRMSPDQQSELVGRITFTTSMAELADCGLVVEAVVERLDLKRQIFAELDHLVRADAVLATNTSSLSVTEIAAATTTPARVVGLHFFNPAPVQALCEVIRTILVAPDVVEDVVGLVRRLGNSPVVAGDRAGFIANALLFGYLNRAVSLYEARYATREDIDAAMQLGCGYPMGPLTLLDLVGLDTAHEILRTMYRQGRDRLHAPSPALGQMVAAGLLGRKTGRGFYTYAAPDSPQVVGDDETPPSADRPARARQVGTVGLVGTGSAAAAIAGALGARDVEVIHVGSGRAEELSRADLVLEAGADDPAAKRAVFEALDARCPDAILATTGSLVPVVECAAATGRPEDVVGMHFAHGDPGGPLVEVVSTVVTSAMAADTARSLCARLGKHAVSCGDRAGFLVDALLFPYLNDAVRMLETGYATADDIDTAMTLGCRLPAGPFEVLDSLGNDVALGVQRALYAQNPEPGLAPAPLLGQLVTADRLGRSTGRGFREHGR